MRPTKRPKANHSTFPLEGKSQAKAHTDAQEDAPKSIHGSSKRITYRVQGLPGEYSREKTKTLLEAVLGFDEEHCDLVVHSVAYSSGYDGQTTATISSVSLAQRLDEKTNQWTFEVSNPTRSEVDGQSQTDWIKLDSHFEGLTPLNSFPNRESHRLDVVALSGLGGHAFTSFKPRGEDFMWLRDTLPADLPGTQIWLYGYDSKLTASQSFQDLTGLASTFRRVLVSARRKYNGSGDYIPIVFLGHSLGGLLLKEALVQMRQEDSPDVIATYRATYGILFFGCPNQGMNIDSLLAWCDKQPNQPFLFTLQPSSERLRQLCRDFSKTLLFPDSRIISFYETKLSPTAIQNPDGVWSMTGPLSVLVDAFSATHGRPGEDQIHDIHPINRSHSEMVKYGRKDVDYEVVLGFLEEFAQCAPAIIQARFVVDDKRNLIKDRRSLSGNSSRIPHFNEIVRWLAPSAYECGHYKDDLDDARSLRYRGTCSWIEARPEFLRWSTCENDPTQSLLWICAIPGAGKTVLASYLVDLQNDSKDGDAQSPPTLYFFCKNADMDKNNSLAVVKALAHQLIQTPQIPQNDFSQDLEYQMDNGGRARAMNVRPLFRAICKILSNLPCATLIIDAADECNDIDILIPGLIELSHGGHVKVVLTSRREPDLVRILEDTLSLEVGPDDIRHDIESYLEFQVSQSSILSHPRVRHRIVRLLNVRSKGMFLWVALMIKELEARSTIEELDDALDSLPDGLNEVYERILLRLHKSLKPSRKTFCCRLLKWITLAKRPLRLAEVGEALRLQYEAAFDGQGYSQNLLCSTRELELICGSLVTVKDETIQLIHLSTKEFLMDSAKASYISQNLHEFMVSAGEDSAIISSVCVMHLSTCCLPGRLSISDPTKKWQMDNALLLEYACLNWVLHLTESSWQTLVKQETVLWQFLTSRESFFWLELCFTIKRGVRGLLSTYLQSLEDRCSLNLQNHGRHRSLKSLLSYWAQSYSRLLDQYGRSLEDQPFEVHCIDPEQVFEPSDLQILESFRKSGSYHRHHILELEGSGYSRNSSNDPTHRALQKHTSSRDEYSFLLVDEKRGVFFMLDKYFSTPPGIFCQEIATGRRLKPILDSELEGTDNRLDTLGASLSSDGRYLGIVYSFGQHDMIWYTAIWLLSPVLDFSGRHSLWARKTISLSTTSSKMGGPKSSKPIAFGNDGFVYCPSGRVNPSTGVAEPIFGTPDPGEMFDVTFSADGQYAVKLCRSSIADVSPGGELTTICSYNCEFRLLTIGSQSSSGRFLTWSLRRNHDQLATYKCYIYDRHSCIIAELDCRLPIMKATLGEDFRFTFYRDEQALLGIFPTQNALNRKVTDIIVWRQCDASFSFWARKTIPGRLLASCLDESHHHLYIVTKGRVWSRLDLNTSDLHNLDSEPEEPQSSRTEFAISQDGAQMIFLRQGIERYDLQVVSLMDLTDLYHGRIKFPHRSRKSDDTPLLVKFSPNLEIVLIGNKLIETMALESEPLSLPLPQLDETWLRYSYDPHIWSNDEKLSEPMWTCGFSACSTYVALAFNPSGMYDWSAQLHIFRFDMKSRTSTRCSTLDFCPSQFSRLTFNFHPNRPELILSGISSRGCVSKRGELFSLDEIKVATQLLDLETETLTKLECPAIHKPSSTVGIEVINARDATIKFAACGTFVVLSSPGHRKVSWQIPSRDPPTKLILPRVLPTKRLDRDEPMNFEELRDALSPYMVDLPLEKFFKIFQPGIKPRLTIVPETLKGGYVTFLLGEGHDPDVRALFSTAEGTFELIHLGFNMSNYMQRLQGWYEKLVQFEKEFRQRVEDDPCDWLNFIENDILNEEVSENETSDNIGPA